MPNGYLKVLFAVTLIASFAKAATADDVQWTDYVKPGTQQEGQFPYQPLYPGAPGSSGMCNGGETRTDGAWYRVCKCFGSTGCFITYESYGTLQCPNDDTWKGKRFWVVTARGRTTKPCGKTAIERTVEIIRELTKDDTTTGGDTYSWNATPGEQRFPNDSEVGKLVTVDAGKRPDETTKTADSEKKTELKTVKSSTSSGTNKRPRKEVKRSDTRKHRTVRARTEQTPAASGGAAARDVVVPAMIGVGIGIGMGGMGHRGGMERGGMERRDR
jgi:hypothetical protein